MERKPEDKDAETEKLKRDSIAYGIRMADLALRGIDTGPIDTVRRHDEDAFEEEVID